LNPVCAAPRIKDPVTCGCVCPPTNCTIGKILDPDTCTCKLPVLCIPQECQGDESWVTSSCSCELMRCSEGRTWCNDACYDLKKSKAHCGSCGNACAGSCLSGICM